MHNSPAPNSYPRIVKSGSVTVKIYRCRNGKYFTYTVHWLIGKRRFRRSFSCEARALDFASETAKNLAEGHVDATTISTTEAAIYREAARLLADQLPIHVAIGEYVTATKRLAEKGSLLEAVDHFVKVASRNPQRRKVPEIVEEFIAAKSCDGLSPRYIEDLTFRLRRFAVDFPHAIGDITTTEIDDWLRALNVSLITRNNFRRLVITFFNFARRRGYLPRDRETEAKWVEQPKVITGPIAIFTPGELAELLNVAQGQSKLAIVLGAFTGIRSAEMLRLNWEDFHWDEEVIELGSDQTKTASRRLVPVLPALHRWIEPFVQRTGSVLKYSLPVCLAEAFATTADRASEVREPDAPPLLWKRNGLRHSYASYRLALTSDVAMVALEMGNSPQKIFSNYRKLVTKSHAVAWFDLSPNGSQPPGGTHPDSTGGYNNSGCVASAG